MEIRLVYFYASLVLCRGIFFSLSPSTRGKYIERSFLCCSDYKIDVDRIINFCFCQEHTFDVGILIDIIRVVEDSTKYIYRKNKKEKLILIYTQTERERAGIDKAQDVNKIFCLLLYSSR